MQEPLNGVMQMYGMVLILVDLAGPAGVVAAEACHQTKMGKFPGQLRIPRQGQCLALRGGAVRQARRFMKS